jgi:glutaredoxin
MVDLKGIKVGGSNTDHKVFLYALSTCGWCKMTKSFLKENGVAYEYIDVDRASSDEKREIGRILKEKKVPLGFPITVIDDKIIISGFKPGEIKEALDL